MVSVPIPVMWILHEWWDDDAIVENLALRNLNGLTLDTVKKALSVASMIVFVCEAQRKLYSPSAPSSVIYVGVPHPFTHKQIPEAKNANLDDISVNLTDDTRPYLRKEGDHFVILSLGIVCPRKNQLWAVQIFQRLAGICMLSCYHISLIHINVPNPTCQSSFCLRCVHVYIMSTIMLTIMSTIMSTMPTYSCLHQALEMM